jgi:hexosaminidase
MLAAHDRVQALEREGRQVFSELTLVFEKSRFPKGRSVGGRAYLHILDDTKDHWADRRPDLSYMFAPEESMGLPQWRQRLLDQIETYAKLHNVPLKALLERRLEQ